MNATGLALTEQGAEEYIVRVPPSTLRLGMMTDPYTHQSSDGDELYCPACGYDLRHTRDPRCPECGNPFDRTILSISRIPWVHRRELGRVRAGWRTIKLVLFSPGKLAEEVALPVSWPDAGRFRWVMVWGVALLIGSVAAVLYQWFDVFSFRVNSDWIYGTSWGGGPSAVTPSEFPFVTLLTGPGVVLVVAVTAFASGASISWWLRVWFWAYGRDKRERAAALSTYLMAWWGVFAILAASDLTYEVLKTRIAGDKALWIGVLSFLHIVVVVVFCARTSVCLKRSTRCSDWKTAIAAVGIPIGSLILIGISAMIVDYALGVIALVGKSLG